MPLQYSRMPGGRGFCAMGKWQAWREQFPELPEDPNDLYGVDGRWRPVADLSGKVVMLTTKDGRQKRETLRHVALPTRDGRGWDTVGWFAHGGGYAGPGICGQGSSAPAEFYPTCGKEVAHRLHEYQEDRAGSGYYCGAVCSACALYWWHEYRLSVELRAFCAKR